MGDDKKKPTPPPPPPPPNKNVTESTEPPGIKSTGNRSGKEKGNG
jgi:hypothetical protein